jgi:ADP-ribosylglycohydrolase
MLDDTDAGTVAYTGRAIAQTRLFDKVWGSILAGAIGDAMGGAVEGLDYREIAGRFGRVDRYLPYLRPPSYHGAFGMAPALYTDDTRLRLVLCRAIVASGDLPSRGEFGHAMVTAYNAATTDLERGFLEEYAFKAIHGSEKLIFAGEPTNGAIMMNGPVGLLCAGAPAEAFDAAYELAFITDGYAKHAAAAMAAAVAEAMRPRASVEHIVEAALSSLARHRERVEGPLWRGSPKRYAPNERAVEAAVGIAREVHDVFALPAELSPVVERGPFFSEAAQSLAVPLAMLVAADGDLRLTILGCVNYGRDNDSYASIAGGLVGALHGAGAVPQEWIEPLLAANPEPDLRQVAIDLCQVIVARHTTRRQAVQAVEQLLR